MSNDNIKTIPAKSEYTETAKKQRLEFLSNKLGTDLSVLGNTSVQADEVQGNIESFIGTVEIPLGIAGPLKVNGSDWSEEVYAPFATTEGALISSLSRGAKAITLAGGSYSRFKKQLMTRVPIFTFENIIQAHQFIDWLNENDELIKAQVKNHSNFAKLKDIIPEANGKYVNLRLCYETGDAAGQNMVTTNAWNICQFIKKNSTIRPVDFLIEGNGSTDKKVSFASMAKGRGCQVHCEVEIADEIIKKVLKVDPSRLVEAFHIGRTSQIFAMSTSDNINIANTIAAIFMATGQDLACVGESSQGQFFVEKTQTGVYCSIVLNNLIIGTVGGGTQLPGQKKALEILGCQGTGKVQKFAEIIASYCLALDISTLSAIAADHFALAHEKLGRNKPKN